MGTVSIWHWLIVILVGACIWVGVSSLIRLLRAAGYSGWWVIAIFIPYVGLPVILRVLSNKLAK